MFEVFGQSSPMVSLDGQLDTAETSVEVLCQFKHETNSWLCFTSGEQLEVCVCFMQYDTVMVVCQWWKVVVFTAITIYTDRWLVLSCPVLSASTVASTVTVSLCLPPCSRDTQEYSGIRKDILLNGVSGVPSHYSCCIG